MLRFIVGRLFRVVVVVVGASLVTFVLLRLAGDPAAVLLPVFATPEQRAELTHDLGLDKPLPVQFINYVGNAFSGDFGESWKYRQPAGQVVWSRFPATLELVGLSLLTSVLLALLLGVFSATRGGRLSEGLVIGFGLIARAVPSFWLGTLLIMFFTINLGWLPTSGRGSINQLIMPVVTIALFFVAEFAIVLRASLIEAMQSEYVQAAVAKGLPRRLVVMRHALRNSLVPLLAVIGVSFGSLLGGTVIVENVFAWPGLGRLAVEAVSQTDYPIIQATVLLLAVTIAVSTMVIDVIQGAMDPRTRRAVVGRDAAV